MALEIHVASDGHDDIRGNAISESERFTGRADLIVYAGDLMAPGTLALHRLRQLYPDTSVPVIYTAGNHDDYSDGNPKTPHLKTTIERQLREMPEVAAELGIILLQDSSVELEIAGMNVRLVGGTLWSDFEARPGYMSMNDAMRQASKAMNDYRLIKVEPGKSRDMLTPIETIGMHRRTVRFIEDTLATPFDGETIVVTHHAPSYRSLMKWEPERPEVFHNMDWCYASDLEHLMHGDNAPALWVHGHVHSNRDYGVGNTRVVANPRGYPLHALNMVGRENPHYDPQKVIELEPRYVPGLRM